MIALEIHLRGHVFFHHRLEDLSVVAALPEYVCTKYLHGSFEILIARLLCPRRLRIMWRMYAPLGWIEHQVTRADPVRELSARYPMVKGPTSMARKLLSVSLQQQFALVVPELDELLRILLDQTDVQEEDEGVCRRSLRSSTGRGRKQSRPCAPLMSYFVGRNHFPDP